MNFGNGNFGTIQTFGAGTHTYTDTTAYASGNTYTACLDTLSPAGCPPSCISVVVPPCNCCPTITASASAPGPCVNGLRQVTFTATVAPNLEPGCPTTEVQWDYGDGNFGPVVTITSITTFNESHYYNPTGSPYTACLKVISPSGCPDTCITVNIPLCDCCPTLSNLAILQVGPCNNGHRLVVLTATVTIPTGCPPVDVQWNFGDGNFGAVTAISSTTTFSVTHLYLANGTSYTACLNVVSPTGCPSACLNVSLQPCSCCPIISTSLTESDCDSSGNFTATLNYNITVPAGCPAAVVQWPGQPASFYAPGFSYSGPPFTNTYNVSSTPVTETLTVIAPPGCPGASVTINAPNTTACNNAKECDTTFLSWLCPLLLGIAMYGLALALTCILLSTCIGLSSIASGLLTLAAIFGIIALIAFVIWLLLCLKCAPCGALFLLFWRVFFEVGLIYAIFAGCCGGAGGFLIGLGIAGLGILFLVLWAIQCKKNSCQILGEILIALTLVIAVATFLLSHFAILSGCLYIPFDTTTFLSLLSFIDLVLAALYVFFC
ncbi:MAG: hypothetical protein M0Z55_03870 [Peptococcaceae bacterium]|nr:hypothetical protein [Peptococcaceae bacterium]